MNTTANPRNIKVFIRTLGFMSHVVRRIVKPTNKDKSIQTLSDNEANNALFTDFVVKLARLTKACDLHFEGAAERPDMADNSIILSFQEHEELNVDILIRNVRVYLSNQSPEAYTDSLETAAALACAPQRYPVAIDKSYIASEMIWSVMFYLSDNGWELKERVQ